MTLLTWSHECIVGVEAMDDQHGILMDTLNELRVMLLRGVDRACVSLQLERLIDFTQMHFQSEEQLLLRQGFPGINEHRTAHHHLLASSTSLWNRSTTTKLSTSLRCLGSCPLGISTTWSSSISPAAFG